MHIRKQETRNAWLVAAAASLCLACSVTAVAQANCVGVTPPTKLTYQPAAGKPPLIAYWIDQNSLPIAKLTSGVTYTFWYDPNANISETKGKPYVIPTGTGVGSLALTDGGPLTSTQQHTFPQISGYELLTWSTEPSLATITSILQDQIVIIGVDSSNTVQYYAGIQDAGVLDSLFAYTGALGPVYTGSGTDGITVSVWAPTASNVGLWMYANEFDKVSSPVATTPMQESNGVWTVKVNGSRESQYYLFKVTVYDPISGTIRNPVGTTTPVYTTDPYSTDLAQNGIKSRFTNLTDSSVNYPTLNGINWANDKSPALSAISDMSIYELHVRDFSSYSAVSPNNADPNLPKAHIGTYLAFTDSNSYGMKHLSTLASAGLRAVHLLPTSHIESYPDPNCTTSGSACQTLFNLNESAALWQPAATSTSMTTSTSCDNANAIQQVQWTDNYDWGYAIAHYMAPEGSYAMNPDNRVNEYRMMVMGLHQTGLRVIQDVVFNHTDSTQNQANNAPPTLDGTVPAYYYRIGTGGTYQSGTCDNCFDTAVEHKMMEKLMIDTVTLMASQYHIDGFRFDIMSALPLTAMQDLQVAISKLSLENADASKIYLYGEGFQAGELPGSPNTNADVQSLAGTGIGAFNDRAKVGDIAPENGCGWDMSGTGCLQQQGFATGLYTNSNQETNAYPPLGNTETALLQYEDFIRCALTGNLALYSFAPYTSSTAATCAAMPYSFDPSFNQIGYTNDPTEAVNDAGDHDGLVLFDSVQLKSPADEDFDSRTRRQMLAQSVMTLGQGIPFFVAGEDGMRSRSMDHSSGNSGDWFNNIDWSFQTNNWGVGLPHENTSDTADWASMAAVVNNTNSNPLVSDLQLSANVFREMLQIRESSGLFHMAKGPFGCNPGYPSGNANYCTTLPNNPNSLTNPGGKSANALAIISNLTFLDTGPSPQVPGMIIMKLDNNNNGSYSGSYTHLLVVFKANLSQKTYTGAALQGLNLKLHPVLLSGDDPIVLKSSYTNNGATGSVTVPGLTTAVFVQ